ncbi:LPXTG cell wall anchor domain-containing protein [Listeria ilorinensis]|uniref:LPXTG cell wall anchor domain-containing protein n=1 Tax=Listeria ilorinensis TaxID=2867439 RepID=UPI001EF6F60E|nr:LPXTG cell wall anchor domain-containing protein [Listeria ilorinensis]
MNFIKVKTFCCNITLFLLGTIFFTALGLFTTEIDVQAETALPATINELFPTDTIAEEVAKEITNQSVPHEEVTPETLVTQDDLNRVIELDLTNKNLTDSDIDEIENVYFGNLHTLKLDNNQLSSFPDLSNAPTLIDMYINNNQLSGALEISSHNKLAHLQMNNNQLTAVTFTGPMNALNTLFLDNNQMTAIPTFQGSAPSLCILNMVNNKLTGNVTFDTINTPFLTQFYADDNQIQSIDVSGLKFNRLSICNNGLQEIVTDDECFKRTDSAIDISGNSLISLPVDTLNGLTETMKFYTNQQRTFDQMTLSSGEDYVVTLPIYNQLKSQIGGLNTTSVQVNGQEIATEIAVNGDQITLPTSLLEPGEYQITLTINNGFLNDGYTYIYPVVIEEETPTPSSDDSDKTPDNSDGTNDDTSAETDGMANDRTDAEAIPNKMDSAQASSTHTLVLKETSAEQNQAASLPTTGDSSQKAAILAGAALLISGLVLYRRR